MVDFVEIDEFFSASGTFLNADGDLSCDVTTTNVVTGYDTEGSSPEYPQFSPEQLPYGSPSDSYLSDDTLVPTSMQVESPPQFASSEPPAAVPMPTEGTPASFNPFEDVAAFEDDGMLGKATTNPLYDSNEALNQLHLVGQPKAAVANLSVLPSSTASANAPPPAATTIAPSSKKKRRASRTVIKQEEAATVVPMDMPASYSSRKAQGGGPPRLTFRPREAEAGKIFSDTQEISILDFQVEADKGFNFSPIDDAFVCQKKNHFQVTASVQLSGAPTSVLVQGPTGHAQYEPIQHLRLAVWGLKDEIPPGSVGIEQSHVDRTKKPFMPEVVNLTKAGGYRTTFSRLHFCETTANNMRKKGKPNPEQRYFKLLVELHATTADDKLVTIFCLESDRIIVRASNPGQFDGETDMKWVKGKVADSIVHHGPVGINTDRPYSALTVNGNMAVTGSLMHPSDLRIKEQLKPMDSREQLDNVRSMRLYEYQVREPWAEAAGRDTEDRKEVGVIAQNMQRVLPDAVKETGETIELSDGSKIDNLLIVDKDRIFMENVGAVQELCRMTENMDNRIRELEILQDSVTSGQYAEMMPLEGDFGYGDRPKRRGPRRKKVDSSKKGEWETLTSPGWSQIPVKAAKESFPLERLICYVIGVLTIFALLIVIVILIAQHDDGDGNREGTTTIASLTAAVNPTTLMPTVTSTTMSSMSPTLTMTSKFSTLTESLATLSSTLSTAATTPM